MLWLARALDCPSAYQLEHFLDLAGHILEKLVFGVCHGRPVSFANQAGVRCFSIWTNSGFASFPCTQIDLFTFGVDRLAAMHPIPFG